jgi:hypothetical protein
MSDNVFSKNVEYILMCDDAESEAVEAVAASGK